MYILILMIIFVVKIYNMKNLNDYTPVGKKDCESICDREVVVTKDGPVIICNGCMRIVMYNRGK